MASVLEIFDSPSQAAEACGQEMLDLADEARSARGVANLAVSGGSTPRIMFEWMARQTFDWKDVHLFWVDERCVPPDNEQSNYLMTKLSLLDAIELPGEQVHRIHGEVDPTQAAETYIADLRTHFALHESAFPVFDVIQRGMGPDAHTASLFPGEPRIDDTTGIAASLWVGKMHQHRVTLLRGVLERARTTLHLITGQDKAEALDKVLHAERDLRLYPAQIASPVMTWYLDRAAKP